MTTIEQQKKDTVAKLEALERLSLDHKALLVSVESVDVVKLIEDHIKVQVTKLENYAKKHGIEFKVDTNSLVAKVKLPVEQPVFHPAFANVPFIVGHGFKVEDMNYRTWYWHESEGEWLNERDWSSSWESSSSNC